VKNFLEDDMADVVVGHTEELLGEPLTLLERKFWIGRHEIDLLFQDRHGGRLIVELQRGSLDRYHLYKVLDYYDEYKDRHPQEFVEVMVVANLISPERKKRLARWGIEYREIPEEVFYQHLLEKQSSSQTKDEGSSFESLTQEVMARLEPVSPKPPEWLQKYIAGLGKGTQYQLRRHLQRIRVGLGWEPSIWVLTEDEVWKAVLATAKYGETIDRRAEVQRSLKDQLYTRNIAPFHLEWTIYHRCFNPLNKGSEIFKAWELSPSELTSLLFVGSTTSAFGEFDEFYQKRETALEVLVQKIIKDPSFLTKCAQVFRTLWFNPPKEFVEYDFWPIFTVINLCLLEILWKVTLKQFGTREWPIGVNDKNQFITRPVKVIEGDHVAEGTGGQFRHLAVTLALPTNALSLLWREGEILTEQCKEGAFPTIENPLDIADEFLRHAYIDKAYTIDQPSEVLLQVGEIKSIVIVEVPPCSCVYKVRFQDDTISFGEVRLDPREGGDLAVTFFSTNALIGFLDDNLGFPGGGGLEVAKPKNCEEFALVAAILRDFWVCEERESYYSGQQKPRKHSPKKKPQIFIRYLPRFKVRYMGIRENVFNNQKAEVMGHHVSGHLRRVKSANPFQIILAGGYGINVPEGFTFVRPHDRGGHERVLYRSRSALKMLYG